MRGDAQALRQPLGLAQLPGLGHRLGGNVAHRDIAALGNELARQLPAHARAASGDHGKLSGEILHGDTDPFFFSLPFENISVMAGLVPAIHVFLAQAAKTWMPGTRPGMTNV
jgi:hypothetical protein